MPKFFLSTNNNNDKKPNGGAGGSRTQSFTDPRFSAEHLPGGRYANLGPVNFNAAYEEPAGDPLPHSPRGEMPAIWQAFAKTTSAPNGPNDNTDTRSTSASTGTANYTTQHRRNTAPAPVFPRGRTMTGASAWRSSMNSQVIEDEEPDTLFANTRAASGLNGSAAPFSPSTPRAMENSMRRLSETLKHTIREPPTRYAIPAKDASKYSDKSSFSELPVFGVPEHVSPEKYKAYRGNLPAPSAPMASTTTTSGPVRVLESGYVNNTNHSLNSRLVVVEFKMFRAEVYHLAPSSPTMTTYSNLSCNSLVIVEADRGLDLGKVICICDTMEEAMAWKLHYMKQHYDLLLSLCQTPRPMDWDEELAFTQFFEFNPSQSPLTRARAQGEGKQLRSVKREATEAEVESFLRKSSYEDKAKKLCCQLIRKHGLNVEIVESEFQLDMHKLTFYFWSPHYLHFSALVTDLFKIFKNRIWLTALNPASCIPASQPSYTKGVPNWYTMRTPRLGERDRYEDEMGSLPSVISELRL